MTLASARTLPDLLRARAEVTPDRAAFSEWGADPTRSPPLTWAEFAARAQRLAAYLVSRGIRSGSRVGILAKNSVDWEIANFAIMNCGGVSVGLDVHASDELVLDAIRATAVEALFSDDPDRVQRVEALGLRPLPLVIAFRSQDRELPNGVVALRDALACACEAAVVLPKASDGALIVFSSGTSGIPKAIEYSHEQVICAVRCIAAAFSNVPEGTRLVCWLPLSNLFQRIIDFVGTLRGDRTWVLATPHDVMAAVREVRPEVLIGVPRFFERIHEGLVARLRNLPGFLSDVAGVALARSSFDARGSRRLWSRFLMSPLIRLLVRRIFGGEVRLLISGSAPMPLWLHAFYEDCGLPVYEAYGVSECVVPIALNRPGERRVGSVGRPLPESEVRISAEGEVEVRGPGLFSGYVGGGGEAAAPGADGFWRTGDLGRIDGEGYLWIEGRRQDTFKLSTGRWVSPFEIERLLATVPGVEAAIVIGEGRKFPVGLLAWKGPLGVPGQPLESFHEDLSRHVERCLSGVAPHQRPVGLLLIPPLDFAAGHLTTNLKIRRKAVVSSFADRIDRFYSTIGGVDGSGHARTLRIELA